ncbi:MAG: YafY family protein [Deltaproteobacteria bacterium]|nr:YafY family protein [Deltaproteobacteria bacterium]
MRRADRLFQIIQRLRRRGAIVTAAQLARELEISERTVYRDVADLIASGVPIESAAGLGYRLPRGGFDLPPLMFTEEEIEALALGARVVKSWGDPLLARAAQDALAKVEAVLPTTLKDRIADAPLFAVNLRDQRAVGATLETMRKAIRKQCKISLEYRDESGQATGRTV